MEKYFDVILIVHLALAFCSVIAGTVAMISRKSKSVHRFYGDTYTYLIIATTITAIAMMMIPDHENTMLFLLALFTLYITISGNRSLKFKVIFSIKKVPILNWLMTISILPLGIYMIYHSQYLLALGDQWGIPLLFFGVLATALGILDIKIIRSVNKPNFLWLEYHSAKMIGSYTGSLTAFAVTTTETYVGLVAWFGPIALGIIAIIFWNLKIKKDPVSVFDH